MTGTIRRTCTQLARRPLFLALAIFGLILLTLGIVYASFYFPARAKLDAAIAKARANGEPVWFSDLDPGPERNPSEDAKQLLALCKQLEISDEDKSIISDAGRIVRNGIHEDSPEVTEQDYQRIAELSETNADLVAQITEIVGRGECWFACDYKTDSPWSGQPSYQVQLDRVSSALNAQMVTALYLKDEALALHTILGYFDFAKVCDHNPILTKSYRLQTSINALLGFSLVNAWSRVAPWSNDSARILNERLAEGVHSCDFSALPLYNRAAALTIMGNLTAEDNLKGLSWRLDSPEELPEWLEEILPSNPMERQLKRWSTFIYRPWMMNQEASLIDLTGRQANWANQAGTEAVEAMKAIDAEIKAISTDMPFCDAFAEQLLLEWEGSTYLRQSVTNGDVLLRLSQQYDGQPVSHEELIADVEAAIREAPAGYLSGKPLKYRIEDSTVTLFDYRPSDQEGLGYFEEFGLFTVRLFQPVDHETAEGSESDGAE